MQAETGRKRNLRIQRMIKPRIGDVWTIRMTPSQASDYTIEVVVKGRVLAVLSREGEKDREEWVWGVIPKDPTIRHYSWGSVRFGRACFISCIKRASRRKRLSDLALRTLKRLADHGDMSFHRRDQTACSLVKIGLAKWVVTTERDYASLHITSDGFRMIEGGLGE